MSTSLYFPSLDNVSKHLRTKLLEKKYIVLFAYNGTGKTRLSMHFKDQAKIEGVPDTLYYNAFTEDLFNWNNDLENDVYRILELNSESRFFNGMIELEMENRIAPLLIMWFR